MILSKKFVSDYIDLPIDLSIKQIAEDMTSVGNEYDSATPLINCTNLVTGEVLECENHPDSDHLHVCKVDVGSEVLNIVCGAPNVRKGLKVIVALPGAKLPGGEIKKGSIRGIESNGMMCSKAELGLDNKFLDNKDKEGIHELDSNVKVGEDVIKVLGLDDEVIDFELTSNRGDLLSILGMAYELGAIYDKKVKDIDINHKETKDSVKDEFDVKVKTDNCSLFLSRKVKDVVIKESPDFIKNRLIASGIRPINNVVDISNYVMLETGQPLHYYDAKRLGNTLVVRMANNGERLTTLDGIERTLDINDIVISNDKDAIGLAGVMGGLSTEVEDDTTDIIIESAIFDSVLVRKTSKKVLRSEASNRFEKGLDPNRTYLAMERSCALLEKYADGKVLSDTIIYDKTNKYDKKIDITCKNINDVLGSNIDEKDIIHVLEKLGFVVNNKVNKLEVIVPTRRLDINIKEDLIEEVGRIYGINNIQGKLPRLEVKPGKYDKTTRNIRNKLVNLGLNEVMTQVFESEDQVHMFSKDEFETVRLSDPLSMDKSCIRYSLLTSLMKIYNYNKLHSVQDISIFEMAKGFYLKDNNYGEDYKLAILMNGLYYSELGNNKKVDFYIVKGIVEELLDYLGYEGRYSFVKDENIPNELHQGVSASIIVNGKLMGCIGKVHPSITKDDVYVAEINIDKLRNVKTGKTKYKEFSRLPESKKDVAFIVKKTVSSETIEKAIKKAGGRLLTSVNAFDVYTGEKVKEDEKSIAYALTFGTMDRTLTEEEVMETFNTIIKKVTETIPATLRDN